MIPLITQLVSFAGTAALVIVTRAQTPR